jgi:translation initiation factor 1
MKIDGAQKSVRVFLDDQKRQGKVVTIISGFQHNPLVVEEIATMLKQYCGAGGTVKGRDIEIQGDQRKKVSEKLTALNFVAK